MADSASQTVLRRKVDAGRASGHPDRPALPARALSTALVRAANATIGLEVVSRSNSERIVSLADLLERLPDNGLLAVLEGPAEGQGVMAFDTGFLSAVIEKQMAGTVSRAPPHPRRVTRTDATLAADLVDATLREFEAALAGREETRWAAGFGFCSHIDEIRPLGLLLEEIEYRVFELALDIETGSREGQIVLALPAEGRGQYVPPGASGVGEAEEVDPSWSPGLAARVRDGVVHLNAVLHRFRLPISDISGMKPGDEIPIPVTAIDNVRLSGAESLALGRCRLGRSQGYRAIRLGVEGKPEREVLPFQPSPPPAEGRKGAGAPPAPVRPEEAGTGGDPGQSPGRVAPAPGEHGESPRELPAQSVPAIEEHQSGRR